MLRRTSLVLLTGLLTGGCCLGTARGAEPSVKKIVLIAGKKSHGPGAHEYERDVKLLKHCLDTSPNAKGVKAEAHFDGWPQDTRTLDDADAIVLLSDGLDKQYPAEQHPFLKGDHLAVIERQVKRGCGIVLVHWPLWVPDKIGNEAFMPWVGGFCDYQNPPGPGMSDKVDWSKQLAHPICRGLRPFVLQDEYYANVRFQAADPRFTAILPFAGKPKEAVWAWAWQREDGGRGFAFIGGHAHANWAIADLRKAVLNAMLWAARAEVPAGGVESSMSEQGKSAERSVPKPIRALIVTGHHHPGHPWRESTRAIQEALWQAPRFLVDVTDDPESLAWSAFPLADYDLMVQNYCNWERGGLSEAARANFARYVAEGGGLVISHFADGAFCPGAHPTTPDANWLEYLKLCRRVWIDGKSGHDAFGPFRVEFTAVKHPITEGLQPFDTVDELYFNQQGSEPVEPLVTARSKVTKKDEPLAFAYSYGKGRVFQNLLGHAPESISKPGPAQLLRRGCVWAAGREQLAAIATAAVPPAAPKWLGKSLDARNGSATVSADPVYTAPPLTVECWAKLNSKTGFNILVSKDPKSSADHWEVYSYSGSGAFSAYLPGYGGEVRSDKDIADGQWHYLAMVFEPGMVRLYVDGVEAARREVKKQGNMKPEPGALAIGRAFAADHQIGCDGTIDEVRISRGARTIDRVLEGPLTPDAQTIGLWHFEDDPRRLRFEDASSRKKAAEFQLKLE